MEIILGILAVAAAVGVIFWVTRGSKDSPVKEALAPTKEKTEVTVKKVTASVGKKLPNKNKLTEMTKKQLLDLGEELGVTNLKQSLKKEDLINDLRTKFAAARKLQK